MEERGEQRLLAKLSGREFLSADCFDLGREQRVLRLDGLPEGSFAFPVINDGEGRWSIQIVKLLEGGAQEVLHETGRASRDSAYAAAQWLLVGKVWAFLKSLKEEEKKNILVEEKLRVLLEMHNEAMAEINESSVNEREKE